ncbi:MAG: cytochrome c3 family protein [Bacteroidota bacterium]
MNRIRLIILPLLAYSLTACSAHKRVDILSFFFDGVPREQETPAKSDTDSLLLNNPELEQEFLSNPAVPPVYYHKPYMEKRCTECHDKNEVGRLVLPEPDLCYHCHDNFSTKFKALHGPVDAGYCIVCHKPHLSPFKNLLSAGGNEHCFPCHVSYEVKQPEDHVEIGDRLCVSCHDPHGIKDRIPRE